MSILSSIRGGVSSALAGVKAVFTPKAPAPIPAKRNGPTVERFWWRDECFPPQMRHNLANDKALMIAENPLLRGLIARHFKEVA